MYWACTGIQNIKCGYGHLFVELTRIASDNKKRETKVLQRKDQVKLLFANFGMVKWSTCAVTKDVL